MEKAYTLYWMGDLIKSGRKNRESYDELLALGIEILDQVRDGTAEIYFEEDDKFELAWSATWEELKKLWHN